MCGHFLFTYCGNHVDFIVSADYMHQSVLNKSFWLTYYKLLVYILCTVSILSAYTKVETAGCMCGMYVFWMLLSNQIFKLE